MSDVEILPLGPDGVLVRLDLSLSEAANRAALACRAHIDALGIEGVVETATSLSSVFVRFRPDQTTRAVVEDLLRGILEGRDWFEAALPEGRTRWHIPSVFEGEYAPDLAAVAEAIDRDPTDAISELTAASLRVLALGFAPGQPYLGFMPEHWNIPRRTEVTPEVPPGAVVVAVRQVIPFSNASPTGWWQIGRTAFRCYDREATPPLALKAGDEIQFRSVSSDQWARLSAAPRGGAETEVLS